MCGLMKKKVAMTTMKENPSPFPEFPCQHEAFRSPGRFRASSSLFPRQKRAVSYGSIPVSMMGRKEGSMLFWSGRWLHETRDWTGWDETKTCPGWQYHRKGEMRMRIEVENAAVQERGAESSSIRRTGCVHVRHPGGDIQSMPFYKTRHFPCFFFGAGGSRAATMAWRVGC